MILGLVRNKQKEKFMKSALTLSEFARIIRTNKRRLKKLNSDYEYARYLFYALPGIDYEKPRIQSSPVYDKITIDLDRLYRIEKKIAYYEWMDNLWLLWQKSMTPRETDVFHRFYMQDKKVSDVASELLVTHTFVSLYIKNLEKKWALFYESHNKDEKR